MNQSERRKYLIKELLGEQPRYKDIEISENNIEHEKLLTSCYENCLSIADENGVKSIAFRYYFLLKNTFIEFFDRSITEILLY